MSNRKSVWPSGSVVAVFLLLAAFSTPAIGQQVPAVHVGSVRITGLPEGWSQRHVVFSNPGTEQEAISAGRHGQWQHVVNSPRYVVQELRKDLPVQGPAAVDANYRERWIAEAYGNDGTEYDRRDDGGHGSRFRGPRRIHHWQREITPPPDIHRDWSIPLGGPGLALGQYPAKYSFSDTNPSCSDYFVYPTGAAGTVSNATIVAFTNIYVGSTGNACASADPTVYWAFNTPPDGILADSATANTSPVLSSDGSQVAFVETYNSDGYLVLLTMANSGGTVTSPATISYVSNANYRGCVGVTGGAPCYTTISLGAADTSSAPFYDYSGADTLYVGDNAGKVHEFTGVFSGTPAMDTLTGWPVTASTTGSPALSSPIYDAGGSNRIFVTDIAGYLHSFTLAAPGTVTTSGQLEHNGISFDPPIVDS
ncbi:MAG TPA: hypothetical protein VMV39_02070, partial [Terracidiphilus sp.]|nr:hypothetical protein [Terracidiphilus sp.]